MISKLMYNKPAKKNPLKKSGFYQGRPWRKVRSIALQRDHYLCQHCLQQKRFTPATDVHHIKPLEDFPELGLDLDNLTSLCWRCHEQTKHRRPDADYGGVRVIRIKDSG